jgi:tetratricopeptide (TPR) repeat protein
VDVFDRDESISLLRQRLPRLAEEDAGQVADAVDNLPLAVTQAAAYLYQNGLTARAYLELLTRRVTTILAQGVPATYPVSLAASMHLAFEKLAAEEPAALALLRLAGQLAPEPIPFTLFTVRAALLSPTLAIAAGDPVAFAALTGLLRRRALARVGPDSLQIHRLVQSILGDSRISTSDDDISMIARRLLRDAVPADPWNDPASWPAWRRLLPHVLAVTDPARADSGSLDVPWLLDRAATYLQTSGEPGAARALFERAHQLYRNVLGEDHPSTLFSANNLVGDLRALGEHQRARALAEDTLTRYRRVLGDDHPDTLCSATNLALVLSGVSEHEQARTLDEDVLRRRRRVLGDDHPDTLCGAADLALVLSGLGKHEEARALAEDTLTRRRRVLGDDHPDTLRSASNLATDLLMIGDHQQARALAEDTLIRCRRVLGDDHPDTLRSANNLAASLLALGEQKQAHALKEWTRSRDPLRRNCRVPISSTGVQPDVSGPTN